MTTPVPTRLTSDWWNRIAMTSEPVIASRQSPAVNGTAHARGKPCIDPGLNITCMGGSDCEPLGQHSSCHVRRISKHLQMGPGRFRIDMIRRHRSEEHTSELQSLMRISYAVFCL